MKLEQFNCISAHCEGVKSGVLVVGVFLFRFPSIAQMPGILYHVKMVSMVFWIYGLRFVEYNVLQGVTR